MGPGVRRDDGFVIARSGSDEAIHLFVALDCFASLAMTKLGSYAVFQQACWEGFQCNIVNSAAAA
jgi:hypothetical protein